MTALLAALGIDGFREPAWIPVALLVAASATALAARRRPASLPWPALAEARAAGARRFDGLRAAALALRAGALLAAGLVLADPFESRPAAEEMPGLDLVLALDASASMRALDVSRAGETRTRFELAREAVARFARERAAEGDRVALVLFGETAFTHVPLTRDGLLLEAALARVEPGIAGEATALGDALVLAARRALGGSPPGEGARAPGEGRLVLLLTDGRSNAGAVPVDVAADVARSLGVRVHTVGVGTSGEVPVAAEGRGLRFERHDLDAAALEGIALATGGRYFHARSSADLTAVYHEISTLERVDRPLPPRAASAPRPEPLLLAAGGLLALEIALARGPWRRLP